MLQNVDFFKTLLNGIKSKFQSQQKQISKHNTRLDDQQAQIEDLKNKKIDAVLYTPQTLTDEQQKQARDNIGADVGGYFEIRVTKSGDTYTADKTYNEIKVAIESGLTPVCRMKRRAANATLDDVFYYYNWQIVDGHPDANAFTFNNMSISVSRYIAIYNSGWVYYFDADYNFYTLPTATSTTLGGVKPVAKTDVMTQDVGVDKNGKLYTEPAEGSADVSLGVSGAAIGQIAKITAVDESGKPTAWEAVDIPTGGGGIDLGLTGAAVGDIIRVKTVDTTGKPTTWESIAPTLSILKTRYDTIVDYTFDGTSTLSTAEGLSDYILFNGCKAVWNKDAQGNPLKAVRMWGYIECTKAVTQENGLSAFSLSAACRGSYFYQDTPSSWYYGDDIGNGVGTYGLNDEAILNSKSISINRTTYGWCDHIARCGAIQICANNNTWVQPLQRSFAAARVPNLVQANYYKDYIYAAMLLIGANKSDYIIPDGVRIIVVAEVIDE